MLCLQVGQLKCTEIVDKLLQYKHKSIWLTNAINFDPITYHVRSSHQHKQLSCWISVGRDLCCGIIIIITIGKTLYFHAKHWTVTQHWEIVEQMFYDGMTMLCTMLECLFLDQSETSNSISSVNVYFSKFKDTFNSLHVPILSGNNQFKFFFHATRCLLGNFCVRHQNHVY